MDKNNVSIFVGELSAAEMVNAVRANLTPFLTRADVANLSDGIDDIDIPLDLIRAGFNLGFLVIELTVWSSIRGETVVMLPFKVGSSLHKASLTVEMESLPRGERWLVQQWGETLQELTWQAVESVADEFVNSNFDADVALAGFYCDGHQFGFAFTEVAEIHRSRVTNNVRQTVSPDESEFDDVQESTLELLLQLVQGIEWKQKSLQFYQNVRVWSRTTARNLHFWETRVVEYIKGNF